MIKKEKKDKYLIITVLPRQIDLSNLLPLKEKIFKLLENDIFIKLNLKNVSYIDSSGIGLIVDIYNTIRNKNGELIIFNVSDDIVEIFEMLNLTKFFNIDK